MKPIAIAQTSPSQAANTRLNQVMALCSALALFAVFYLNGAFTHRSAPQPPQDNTAASGVPLYRTTSATTEVTNVVTKALAFEALLTTSEVATLQQTYTTSLARKWSNLPCGAGCRNGIEFGDLTADQLTAALVVIEAALSSDANNGFDEFAQIRLAEIILNTSGGGSGYDTTLRWISFLNTPSATGSWMLQFGGHHYAANIAFNNGHIVGATPFLMGLEPKAFTWDGTVYAPLNDEHAAFTMMLASLTSSELATAKLTTTFTDCTMVPGETNGGTGTFPATKVGVSCSSFTTAQKALVLAAIQNYVGDMDAVTAASIMAVYTREIDGTFIAFTGSGTSGDSSTFLNAATNYVRIDGPTVWIEMACQNGVVFPTQLHYHTVWRDHSHDYGLDLTGDPVDTTVSTTAVVAEVTAKNSVVIYPNPATSQVSLSMASEVSDATIILTNAMGQSTVIATHFSGASFQYDISRLPAGLYMLKIQAAGSMFTGKFNKP